MNIIGDIAGQYKTLMALVSKMPQGPVISLGDMVDRGPDSKAVLDYFKNHQALLGNHEHLLIDAWDFSKKLQSLGLTSSNWKKEIKQKNLKAFYQAGLWIETNGGDKTLLSYDKTCVAYDGNKVSNLDYLVFHVCDIIPESDVLYLKSLPLFIEKDNLFISHAPKMKRKTPQELSDLGPGFWDSTPVKSDISLIWNRKSPSPYLDKFQIFGHNSYEGVRVFSNQFLQGIDISNPRAPTLDKAYAVGIDTSSAKILTGIHYPSLTLYHQEFID